MPPDQYLEYQSQKDHEYKSAWKEAPETWKEKAKSAGIEPHVDDQDGHALEYDVNYASAGYTIDIAAALDSQVDELVEIHGDDARKIIQDVVDRLVDLADKKVEQNNSLKLARVVMMLVSGGKKNVLAKVHSLMHAVPRLAIPCGFSSMRHSARECGVSVTWIAKVREQFCEMLEIAVPVESSKSDEAKAEYKKVATTPGRHWRRQVFKSDSHQTQTHDTSNQTKLPNGASELPSQHP
jgi:hypothetical protein